MSSSTRLESTGGHQVLVHHVAEEPGSSAGVNLVLQDTLDELRHRASCKELLAKERGADDEELRASDRARNQRVHSRRRVVAAHDLKAWRLLHQGILNLQERPAVGSAGAEAHVHLPATGHEVQVVGGLGRRGQGGQHCGPVGEKQKKKHPRKWAPRPCGRGAPRRRCSRGSAAAAAHARVSRREAKGQGLGTF